MRVLVIDDSAFMRRAIRGMLESDPAIEIVGCARGGEEGLKMAEHHRPDVITLDVEMPDLDGITVLQRIMTECPTQVLMLSSLTTDGSHTALRALKLGAADVLAKDTSQISLSVTNIQNDLITRVKALGRAGSGNATQKHAKQAREATTTLPTLRRGSFNVVCIGSSTGGPPVLESLVTRLPADWRLPIVIAQHMPAVFTQSLAERLDQLCAIPVRHIENGMSMENGTVYIAPGGMHTRIIKQGLARWSLKTESDDGHLYKPSVDALFESAADAMGSRVLAIVLTGMGDDGKIGAGRLHEKGAMIFAQDAASCVVYGMPKAVNEAGYIQAALPPDQISRLLCTMNNPNTAQPATTTTKSPHAKPA
mgnify:CR=1 FL=1